MRARYTLHAMIPRTGFWMCCAGCGLMAPLLDSHEEHHKPQPGPLPKEKLAPVETPAAARVRHTDPIFVIVLWN